MGQPRLRIPSKKPKKEKQKLKFGPSDNGMEHAEVKQLSARFLLPSKVIY
jgi:hypothetical protein